MAATADTATRCPTCGAPAATGGQLMCLECGARMGVVFRRTASWKAPLAIAIAVLAILAVAAILALNAIRNRADDEVGGQAPTAGHVAPT